MPCKDLEMQKKTRKNTSPTLETTNFTFLENRKILRNLVRKLQVAKFSLKFLGRSRPSVWGGERPRMGTKMKNFRKNFPKFSKIFQKIFENFKIFFLRKIAFEGQI